MPGHGEEFELERCEASEGLFGVLEEVLEELGADIGFWAWLDDDAEFAVVGIVSDDVEIGAACAGCEDGDVVFDVGVKFEGDDVSHFGDSRFSAFSVNVFVHRDKHSAHVFADDERLIGAELRFSGVYCHNKTFSCAALSSLFFADDKNEKNSKRKLKRTQNCY